MVGFPLFGVGLGCRLLLRFSFAEIRFAHFSSAETRFARFSFAETRFARFQAAFQTGFGAISGSVVSTKFKFKKQPALFILCGNRRGFGNLLSLLRGRVLGFAAILGAGCHRSESVIQPTDVHARGAAFQSGYGGDTPCSAFEMTAVRSGLPSPAGEGRLQAAFCAFRLPAR